MNGKQKNKYGFLLQELQKYCKGYEDLTPEKLRDKMLKDNRDSWGETYLDRFAYAAELNGGVFCYICGGQDNLVIDHEHPYMQTYNSIHENKSGRIRGLLCLDCNTKLGWFEHRHKRILDYVTKT